MPVKNWWRLCTKTTTINGREITRMRKKHSYRYTYTWVHKRFCINQRAFVAYRYY